MKSELDAKFQSRGRSTEDLLQIVDTKEERLRRLWRERLAQQVSDLPPYGHVFRDVRRALRVA